MIQDRFPQLGFMEHCSGRCDRNAIEGGLSVTKFGNCCVCSSSLKD